jgi:hypothetical protein
MKKTREDLDTDGPAFPRTAEDYAAIARELPAADHERLHKPFQPLPPGTKSPPMTELWR